MLWRLPQNAFDLSVAAPMLGLLGDQDTNHNSQWFMERYPEIFGTDLLGTLQESASSVVPPWVFWKGTSDAVITIKGLQGPELVTAWLQSFNEPSRQWFTDGILDCFRTSAQAILDRLNATSQLSGITRICIVGHSWGGATAIALASMIRPHLFRTAFRPTVITFGAPKCIRSGATAEWSRLPVQFIRTAEDPVPDSPPSGNTSPWFNLLHRTDVLNRIRTQVQPRGLVSLPPLPAQPSLDMVNNRPFAQWLGTMATWATGIECWGSPQHSYGSYVARVNAHEIQPEQSWGNAEIPARAPLPEVANNAEMGDAIAASLNGRTITPSTTDEGAVAMISPTVTRIPQVRYRRKTIGRDRVVTYNGIPVAYCTTKKTQRRLCKALNKTL